MTGGPLRFRIRKGDFEVELEGDEGYVRKEYETLRDQLSQPDTRRESKETPHSGPAKEPQEGPSHGLPTTFADKFERLKQEGVFSNPRSSGEIARILRDRGWGVFLSKDVSSRLKEQAPRIGLRRVPLGKGKYGYTFP